MEEKRAGRYNHVEAFCLMIYRSKDGRVEEILWNSRDGVTPFIILAKDGETELTHVEWGKDFCFPDFKPAKGQRVFVDLTIEKAKRCAGEMVSLYWDHPTYPMSRRFESKEEAVEAIARGMVEDTGQPTVAVAGDDYPV